MTTKRTVKAKTKGKTIKGTLFSGYLDEALHSALKDSAAKSERTLVREINYRLKQSIAMQAAE